MKRRPPWLGPLVAVLVVYALWVTEVFPRKAPGSKTAP